MKKCFFALLMMVLMALLPAVRAIEAGPALVVCGDVEQRNAGEKDFLCYPMLANAGEHTDTVNEMIWERMQLSAYQNVMKFGTGNAGLQVDFESTLQGNVLSLVISANGKMPAGRPSQVYYPLNIDLLTGEEIPFDVLFADAEGALAYMELRLEEREESLSTHLENRSLFPVPVERYTLDENGGLTVWYERDQLSFLSGFSGSVYFRFSELEPYYDLSENGYVNRILEKDTEVGFWNGLGDRNCLGLSLEDALKKYRSTVDSEYYPGGAVYETEDARMQGTLLITDETEETVKGLISSNLDDNGIVTGKTTLQEAKMLLGDEGVSMLIDEETALQYRVCAGESMTYRRIIHTQAGEMHTAYTLFADENGVVQYIKLMMEE